MVKVRATAASKMYNKAFKEFHRIVNEGEEFEITEERYKFLHGGNEYKIIFVEPITEEKPVVENTVKVNPPVLEEEPDIFIIEPGKEPVKVDDELKPIDQPKPTASKPKTTKSTNSKSKSKTTK